MAVRIALSGFLALVVAMGIGRFAFTPQVPLMIAEHQFSLTAPDWLLHLIIWDT